VLASPGTFLFKPLSKTISNSMPTIQIHCAHSEVRELAKLVEHPRNPNKHPQAQLKLLGKVIATSGWRSPIVVSKRSGYIIKGHGRFQAALMAGMEFAPVDLQDYATEADEWADMIADNRIAELAEISVPELRDLLSELSATDIDMDRTGFDDAALAEMLGGLAANPDADAEPQIDKADELREKWGVEPGQLWQLGEHRLLCGDSTKEEDVKRLMNGESAAVCLTDPPYGLGSGKESGKNNYDQHDDTKENLIVLANGWLPIARKIAKAVVFSPGVTNAWIYPEANWIMCWFYGGGQLRSSWGFNCWQPFLCYGKDPSLASGNGGRPDAIDMNTPANSGDLDHPCPKPVKLWVWFIERLSFKRGEVFYEPFSGSGTTIIACEQLGRKCRAIEISPAYVAVAIQRWADATGKEPVKLS